MSKLNKIICQRIGWDAHLKPFLNKKLPSNLGWSATLGSLCVILFGVMAVTGMVLAMYYSPSPDKAYASIDYIMNEVPLGALLRGLHHWGAGAMVLAVFLHLLSVFFSGSFKAPRELTWIFGVCLLLITLGLGFTGYLLPWDQKAFWATVVSANIPKDIPVIGQFITNLLLSGGGISGFTITRFYAIHMLVLPSLMLMLIAGHIYLVRLHGMCEHESSRPACPAGKKTRIYRFFPEHMARSSVVFLVVLGIIFLLSLFGEIPREDIARTIDENYLPRPEWYYMWLFQLLTYFSGSTEVIGSLVIPTFGVLLLFALPFIEKSKFIGSVNRPLAVAAGVTVVVGIVYLSVTGFAGTLSYGDTFMIPSRTLSKTEKNGLRIYAQQECAYCHNIMGKGGRRIGPDLSNIKAKGRTREYLASFIKDPQSQSRFSVMPKYALQEDELYNLSEFILALDFTTNEPRTIKNEPRTIKKEDIIPKTITP
jgi:ubiquinol-cytochrome c reductase cytochrome b subunit